MVSGDEILWSHVGNHGTARNTPNSTEKTRNTAAYAAYGKDGKTKEVGCLVRPSIFFLCGSCPKSLRLQLGRHAIPHVLHANPRKRINRTSEASHFLSLSVFSVSRVAAVFCVFSSVKFGVFRAVPWLPTYVQRPARKVSTCIEKSIIRHLCVSRSDRLILRYLSNSHTPKNWCDASGCTTGKN